MTTRVRQFGLICCIVLLGACQSVLHPKQAPPEIPTAETTTPISTEPSSPPATAEAGTGIAEIAPAPESSDHAQTSTGDAVFARLKQQLSPGACAAGDTSARWRQRYARSPSAFAQQLTNILPLLDFVTGEVERSGLPGEFALIPIVESWYRPEAIGSGGPAGMWQMIASTARNHGIHIKPGYDGRLSPVESTRAALSYLATLTPMFNHWQATVMAYNAGEYRLLNAFKRSGSTEVSAENRRPAGLSHVTYDYVAKLQALSCLISEPEQQGLLLPLSARFQVLVPVLVGTDVRTLDQLAGSTGLAVADLRKLNPGYKAGRIVADVPRLVLMPAAATAMVSTQAPSVAADQAEQKIVELSAAPPSSHKVRSGDSLWTIAKHYGISLQQLVNLNGLSKQSVLHPGQHLKIAP